MSSEPIDPTSSARALYAVQLRRARTAAKMTQSQLGGHPDVMVSGKLIEAVENLRRAPTRRLSVGLDKAFDLEEFFLGLYAAIRRESGIPSDFLEYTEYEENASSIKIYENFLILGLLQTEEYVREVLRAGQRPGRLEELVAARLARQEILRRDDPPWLDVLLDESVIRRIVGDREIMRGQLEHLLEAMREPNITIRIVPAGAPMYPSGAFNLLGFPDAPAIGYAESVNGLGRLIEPGREVSALGVTFDQIGAVALTPADLREADRGRLGDHVSAFDFSSALWRKSSHSGQEGTSCVEVAAVWRKSSHSGQEGTECIEVACLDRAVAVRDSKDPDGPKLAFSRSAWCAFASRVVVGRLDRDPSS